MHIFYLFLRKEKLPCHENDLMKLSPTLFFFGLLFLSEILIQIFGVTYLNWLIKPLIVPVLGLWYFQQTGHLKNIFVAALFFCWLGDVCLLIEQKSEWFFIAGLGSFLLAHVLLILSYRKFRGSSGEELNIPQKMRASLPVILAGTGLITILFPRLGGLQVPVMIYTTAVIVMVLQSFFRYGLTSTGSFWSVSFGAIAFLLSDSLLALNKFLHPIYLAGVWVMATYMAAVFLIVRGMILHPDKR